jgi:hypothetical protein
MKGGPEGAAHEAHHGFGSLQKKLITALQIRIRLGQLG